MFFRSPCADLQWNWMFIHLIWEVSRCFVSLNNVKICNIISPPMQEMKLCTLPLLWIQAHNRRWVKEFTSDGLLTPAFLIYLHILSDHRLSHTYINSSSVFVALWEPAQLTHDFFLSRVAISLFGRIFLSNFGFVYDHELATWTQLNLKLAFNHNSITTYTPHIMKVRCRWKGKEFALIKAVLWLWWYHTITESINLLSKQWYVKLNLFILQLFQMIN